MLRQKPSWDTLADAGDEDSTLLLVLVTKLLAVPDLLLPGPAPHLQTANGNEEQNTPAKLANEVDTKPRKDLKHIVGASHEVEPKSRGNASLGSTRATEVAQNHVRIQVGQFAKHEQCNADIHKGWIGRGGSTRVRAEDPVGNVETGQCPVVGAVLEDVASRHGGIAEAVHKHRLKLALQEVDGQQGANQQLQVRRLRERLVEAEVQQRAEREEEQGGDQERSEVLDDEDGAPCDLGT